MKDRTTASKTLGRRSTGTNVETKLEAVGGDSGDGRARSNPLVATNSLHLRAVTYAVVFIAGALAGWT